MVLGWEFENIPKWKKNFRVLNERLNYLGISVINNFFNVDLILAYPLYQHKVSLIDRRIGRNIALNNEEFLTIDYPCKLRCGPRFKSIRDIFNRWGLHRSHSTIKLRPIYTICFTSFVSYALVLYVRIIYFHRLSYDVCDESILINYISFARIYVHFAYWKRVIFHKIYQRKLTPSKSVKSKLFSEDNFAY